MFWGDLEGAGTLCPPPHSSYKRLAPLGLIFLSLSLNFSKLFTISSSEVYRTIMGFCGTSTFFHLLSEVVVDSLSLYLELELLPLEENELAAELNPLR